jgi:hypothetical protein
MAGKQAYVTDGGWKFLPLLGKLPHRFIVLWHKRNKKVKYKKSTDMSNEYEEFSVESKYLPLVKTEICQKLGVRGWAAKQKTKG